LLLRFEPLSREAAERDSPEEERLALPERSLPLALFRDPGWPLSVYWFLPEGLWLFAIALSLSKLRRSRRIGECPHRKV